MDVSDILSRLEGKIDKQGEHLASVDVTLARQAASLEEHMRRSDLLEKGQEAIRTEAKALEADLRGKLEPLTKAHHMWAGIGKLLAILGTLATIAEAVRVLMTGHL